MVSIKSNILFLLSLMISCEVVSARNHGSNGDAEPPEFRIECVMPEREFYEGQPVPITVTLFSTSADVAFANPVSLPRLEGEDFSTSQVISPAGNAYERDIDGKHWYCFPLSARMVTLDNKGKYVYGGGSFVVGVNYPTVVRDPFWGPMRTVRTEEFEVPVQKVKFRVKSVPAPPKDLQYSGSVGTFELKTVVPEGDIFVGEEATAYIILSGTGMIAESTLPEYRDAFKNGVSLKSVTESRDEGHDSKGRMLSEIKLECTFIPTDRENAVIGEARFDFFNPSSGKYETIKSKPVKIKVKSTASKRSVMSI